MGPQKKKSGLYELLITLTGLEPEVVEKELSVLMERLGLQPETLNTEDIRRIMALYLEEFHADFASRLPQRSVPADWQVAPQAAMVGEGAEA